MINVVIIDSGVDLNHPAFSKDTIVALSVNDAFSAIDEYGHGTAVYGIIRKCPGIKIINIKIPNIENGVECSGLVQALRYVLEKVPEANIINLSLGVNIEENRELYDVCSALSQKGTIIVSAFDNANSISYPAAYENVIGVVSGRECVKTSDFVVIHDDMVDIAAKGGIQRVCWANHSYMMISGNSFACAHVTFKVAQFMQIGLRNKEEILEAFARLTNGIYNVCPQNTVLGRRIPFKIEKAILFPFNKEMHSLIRFANMLPFDIVDVYDVKYASTTGLDTKRIIGDNVKELVIKNIDCLDIESFDTIILGHTDRLQSLLNNKKEVMPLIKRLIAHNKSIYSFDDIRHLISIDSMTNIFCPYVDKNDMPSEHLGMLYQISKPVLSVFGTSSIQGKFTLQLILREIMQHRGYRIGQIGSEPSSLLFGMDYVYPMGYNSSVYLSTRDSVQYLNSLVNELAKQNVDLIITGSQSGSVPYEICNMSQINIENYSFLMGVNPDAIVLCVNPYDEIQYIRRSIEFLESSVDCKVIGLVVYPMSFADDWSGYFGKKTRINFEEFQRLRNLLEFEFHRKVFLLGEKEHMEQLVDLIECFFVEE